MKTEPVTRDQVNSLIRALGFGAMVCDFGNIDYTRGRGVLDGTDRCLWTKKGHRITVGLITGGGIVASQSKDPDPEIPDPQYGGNGDE